MKGTATALEELAGDETATELPRGWTCLTLNDVGTWTGGGTPSKGNDAFWTNGSIPWVSPKDMKCFAISDSQDRITEDAVEKSAAKLISAGSVLFVTRSGILQHTFPVGVSLVDVTVNQDLKAITPHDGIMPSYVAWYLIASNNRILHDCSKDGTTVQSIDTDQLKRYDIPIAPYTEQRRIVSKIDELFSDIEAGERALARARTALARYRKSVLKAAVTGALTKDWREANKDKLEPAEKLLARILDARRAAWEKTEFARLSARGQAPKDDGWRAKLKAPVDFWQLNGTTIPNEWVWASLDMLCWSSSYGTSTKCDYDFDGISVLRIPNVRGGSINYDDLKYAKAEADIDPSDLLAEGDLLVVRTNGSEAIIGIGAVIDKPPVKDAYFASYLIRFRLINQPSIRRWVNLVWQSDITRQQIRNHAATSAGQYNVSQSNLARFPIPVPPEEEQAEIVSRVAEAFSKADHVEAALDHQQRASKALRQSILKSAFEGRLVPQDPTDEPAAKLLERIKATKGR